MLKEKIQQMPQVELSAFPPLNMASIYTKTEHPGKVKTRTLKPPRKQEQINLQVLTKLIEHIEKNL